MADKPVITEIPPELEAQIPEWVKRWTGIGLDTSPADRPRAEAAIRQLYEISEVYDGDKEALTQMRLRLSLTDSQQEAIGKVLQKTAAADDENEEASAQDALKAVRAELTTKQQETFDKLTAELGLSVFKSPEIIWAGSPDAAIRYLVDRYGETEDETPKTILDNASMFGAHDCYWVANYLFLEKMGVKYEGIVEKAFRAAEELTRSCGWIWLYHEICVACERHTVLHLDDENPGRLHCEDGPALAFPDGWSLYAIHGVRVPKQVIMAPETLTTDQIREESNAEVRRIMRERYGDVKYLRDIGATVIDTDARDVSVVDICEGRATSRALVEDDEGTRFLIGKDGSSERVYVIRVPNNVTTCREAHESLAGFSEDRIISQS